MNEAIKIFQARLDETKDGCNGIADGVRGAKQLRWMFGVPQDGEPQPGKFDHAGFHRKFDRSEAAENYFSAVAEAASDAESGKVSGRTRQELALAKFQSDFLSGMERDLHQRRRSRLRMLAHEATARRHTGSSRGVIQANLMDYVQAQQQRISKIRQQ